MDGQLVVIQKVAGSNPVAGTILGERMQENEKLNDMIIRIIYPSLYKSLRPGSTTEVPLATNQ